MVTLRRRFVLPTVSLLFLDDAAAMRLNFSYHKAVTNYEDISWLRFGSVPTRSLLAHEIPNILAMRDQTFAVFQRTIKNDIGDNDLYVSASDVEAYLSSIEPNMASRAL